MNTLIVLKNLSDGAWHTVNDLSTETQIDKEKILYCLNFFCDFGFVEISNDHETAKIDNDYLNL